jgi:hypothetical protein
MHVPASQRTESARDAQCSAEFVQRAKVWWADYVRMSPDFKSRPVKVSLACSSAFVFTA